MAIRLGLPRNTSFDPVVVLHNFRHYPMNITLAVGYGTGDGQQELSIPLTLPPGDTQVIRLHPYLENVLPQGTHWASLEVSYTGHYSGLAAAMVSTSQDGAHSIRSVLNWVEANIREGWHWRADGDHNTLLGIYNADSEPAQVKVSLDYYSDGQRRSYDLPELSLQGRGSELVDIGAIIASRSPDHDGDTIPNKVGFGGYLVRKTAGNIASSVVTEALLFNGRTKNFLTFYNTGCCYDATTVEPPTMQGPPGGIGNAYFVARNMCSGQWEDLSWEAQWWSDDNSIASTGGAGTIHLISPGQTYVRAEKFVSMQGFSGFCSLWYQSGACGVTVTGCGDERDDIRQEYSTFSVNLDPDCPDFTQTRSAVFFTFTEINTGDYQWALVRDPFVAPASSGFGMDRWRQEYGGPRIINSAYRNPARHAAVGGASQSRHMFGDAADLRNQSLTEDEWQQMFDAAGRANADFIEPRNGPCGVACVHADWRNHGGDYRP